MTEQETKDTIAEVRNERLVFDIWFEDNFNDQIIQTLLSYNTKLGMKELVWRCHIQDRIKYLMS